MKFALLFRLFATLKHHNETQFPNINSSEILLLRIMQTKFGRNWARSLRGDFENNCNMRCLTIQSGKMYALQKGKEDF